MPDDLPIEESSGPVAACPLEPPDHHAYLLRLWRTSADTPWRASLQSVRTGERHMFADMTALLAFLHERTRIPDEDHYV